MSKFQKNIIDNNINISSPKPRSKKIANIENTNNNTIIKLKKTKPINPIQKKEEPKIIKTPQEILALLLKKNLDKSLFKLEKRTNEQKKTLKEIGKYFILFETQIISMKNGVERKRREEEKKQKMALRKIKQQTSTPLRIRSRTVQNVRKHNINTESNRTSINRTNIKANPNIKMIYRTKTSGNLNLENTPKIRSKTVKSSKYNKNENNNNYMIRKRESKEIINTPKRIKNEEKEKEKMSNTLTRKDSRRISRSRKNTIHKNKEENKTTGTERIGRKSIHRIKKNNSIKKLIKSNEEKNKNNINITTNINTLNKNSINSIKSSNKIEESISNFSKENNNINENFDVNLNESIKNININEILNDKKEEDKKNNNNKNVLLKELEEFNNKKPKMEESKNNNNNEKPRNSSRSRSRSRSKNENIEDYREMEGSLNDMKITLQGLNILKRPEKKIKFEKKKKQEKDSKREEIVNKEMNDLLESGNNIKIINNKENNNITESTMKKLNLDYNNNNINRINKNFNMGKESQIMNEEIIHTIESDKNLVNSSILESKINFLNKNIEKIDFIENEITSKNDKEDLIKSVNNEIGINENNNNNIDNKINDNINKEINNNNEIINNDKEKEKEMEKDKEKNKEKEEEKEKEKENENNEIKNLEKKLDEKINTITEEKKEIIQSESGIMHDEQLVDPNQSSLINQSSIMNQSAILAEQYVLISRNDDEPFTIENTLKFEKSQILPILDFLNFEDKIQFTGINRGFNIERIYILNNKREEIIRSLDLASDETIDDLIMKTKLKYSNDELNKKFTEFQLSRGAVKAVELLNNPLYSKLFKKPVLDKNAEEICNVYRTLFTLLGEYQIANIPEDEYFWIKCTEYLNNKSEGKIGSFILEKFKKVTFEKQKIVLMNKFLIGMKKKINPNYFPKICGTTGLLIFLIKDALEYCGVIINDKKTQPARILDNLMYYKNTTETLAQIIEYLSGVKTYKIREKKKNENE